MEETTLLFRHLPSELSAEERKDLLHHFGATRVQVMERSGAMKNTAFAVFQRKEDAAKIVKQLHQVQFLGSTLKVEFSNKNLPRVASVVDNEGAQSKEPPDQLDNKNSRDDLIPEQKEVKFDDTFNAWGLKHPRKPDMCYLYPPPTPATLTNIMHALAVVPKFYVQVLHLMNKMDLPAPFGALTSAPPMRPGVRGYAVQDNVEQREMDISSETESELESDGENRNKKLQEQLPVKRKVPIGQRPDKRRKHARLSELQASRSTPGPSHASEPVSRVFEQALAEHPAIRRIELKLPDKILPEQNVAAHPPFPFALPSSTSAHSSHFSSQSLLSSAYPPLSYANPSLPMPAPPPTVVGPFLQPQSAASLQENVPVVLPTLQDSDNSTMRPQQCPSQVYQRLAESHDQALSTQNQAPSTSPTSLSYTQLPYETDQSSAMPARPAAESQQHSYDVSLPPSAKMQETVANTGCLEEAQGVEETGGGFGVLLPQPKTTQSSSPGQESHEKEWSKSKFISSFELKRLRLSKSEMKDYSVFRRYNEGEPSCRLYIKNLAKQITEEDVHWIFGRYVNWDDEREKNIFDIRLMKEGRMKGQAFVTLPSERAAFSALKDTNGLMLKEKPMAVQFARSAKAPEDEASKP